MGIYIKYWELWDLIENAYDECWNRTVIRSGKEAELEFQSIIDKCKQYEFPDEDDE